MTHINYTYEVTAVDPQVGAMEITYHNDKYGTMVVGAPIPLEGTSVEDIVKMYSPVASWLESERKHVQVTTGLKGSVDVDMTPAPAPKRMSIPKVALAKQLRDIPTAGSKGDLWTEFKLALKVAPDVIQEDWALTSEVNRDDPVLTTILEGILTPEGASLVIDTIYDGQPV